MTNNTNQVELLTKENVRLYEENIKLKLMLGNTTKTTNKNTKEQQNKTNKNTKKKNVNNTKKNTNTKTSEKKVENKTENKDANLSKFQKEREAKKAIVATKRNEKVPVPEIAKMIGQSEPTVRNYIRELRVEGKLSK